MNSYTDNSTLLQRQRDRLEALLNRPTYTAYHPTRIIPLVGRLGKSIVNWMTTGSMPQISKEMQGETEVWRVYDPIAHRTLYFDREETVRAWMDQRYYE